MVGGTFAGGKSAQNYSCKAVLESSEVTQRPEASGGLRQLIERPRVRGGDARYQFRPETGRATGQAAVKLQSRTCTSRSVCRAARQQNSPNSFPPLHFLFPGQASPSSTSAACQLFEFRFVKGGR